MTARDVARKVSKGLLRHNALGIAAELAYFTFLSIFPFLICLVALSSILPTPSAVDEVRMLVARVLPRAMVDAMVGQMIQLSRADNLLIIALGLLGALWSGSSALHSLMSAVNRAYDANDRRRWRDVRLAALWLTISTAVLMTAIIGVATVVPWLAARATDPRGAIWVIFGGSARWILIWAAIMGVAMLVYTVSLDVDDRSRARLAPGAAVAATIWTIATVLLHLYVSHIGSYGLTYGALGGAMFVLLWFYFTNLSVLIGAEVNGELSKPLRSATKRAA